LRHFNILPEGFTDISNLYPEQKEYMIYLMAGAPSIDQLTHWINYEFDKLEIKEKDFSHLIKTPDMINKMIAKKQGITLKEYKDQLCDIKREKALEDLQKKYGFEDEPETFEHKSMELLNKYHQFMESRKADPVTEQVLNANKIFDIPPVKKEEGA
jgi:hypothetical protein